MRDSEKRSANASRSRSKSNSSKENSKKSDSDSDDSKSSHSKSRSRSRSSELDGYRLHIADIADNVRKSELEKFFAQFGTLKELWMTNSPPCFGFAVFKDKESANSALKGADGASIGGSRIRVTHARPRTKGYGRRFFNPNMRCYQCGYAGHFYRDCPDLNDGESKNSRSDSYRDRSRRRRDREYYSERDYGRRYHRSSRRNDDYGRRSSRRRRY